MMRSAKDLRHERNRVALERVRAWGSGNRLQKQVLGLPVTVRTLGAAAAVALLASRKETSPLALDMVHWLAGDFPLSLPGGETTGDPIRNFLEKWGNIDDQRAAHALDLEALRFAEALKLFATSWYHHEGDKA